MENTYARLWSNTFLKESLSSLLAESKPTCTRRFMYAQGRWRERERDQRQNEEGETPHACLRIVYPLFISQNLKIIPHLIPPLAAVPSPCFIHVAINKEQKTVFCKVTHRMRTKGRQYLLLRALSPTNQTVPSHTQVDTFIRIINYYEYLLHTYFLFFQFQTLYIF